MMKIALFLLVVVAVASAQYIASIASPAILRSSTQHGNGYANGYALPYAYGAYNVPTAYSAYSYGALPGYGVHPY